MSSLRPCPSCARHVRATESSCPFCAATLRVVRPGSRALAVSARGLSRAALFALGSVAAAACSDDVSSVPFYGCPPPECFSPPEEPGNTFNRDARAPDVDAGASDAGIDGNDGADASDDADGGDADASDPDGSPAPAYGGPPP